MSRRRFLLPAVAVMALALPAPASAVVKGEPARQGDYPGQVFVGKDTNGNGAVDEYCAGTLVGSRQVLTAARCATYALNQPLPEVGFKIRIGDVVLADANQYAVAAGGNDRHEAYDPDTGANDIAMLTLSQPVDFAPVRVVEATESPAWAPGTLARVMGWGETQGGFLSNVLRTGEVSILPDADCTGTDFDATVMACAAGASENPCPGDSGSPLLVPDGGFFALAGVFSGAVCSTPGAPGVYARVGDDPLNAWVHDRTPEADFDFDHAPRAKEQVTLTSISRHPEGPTYFKTFRWDLDNDGAFDDATGKSVRYAYPAAGEQVTGLEASRAGGDKATIYYAFDVGADPNSPAQPGPSAQTRTPAPVVVSQPTVRLATISSAKRPKVRRGRFSIRVRFARTVPRGIAVIEVFRGKRKIGIARTRVKRGASKRVRVKLTPTGRRLLGRSTTRLLKVKVRVRVGRTVLRSKTLRITR